MKELTGKLKSLIRRAVISFALALGLIIGAGYVVGTWHDTMLLCAGVLLGVLAVYLTLIEIRVKGERVAREVKKERGDSEVAVEPPYRETCYRDKSAVKERQGGK